jgi:hypothetical protein
MYPGRADMLCPSTVRRFGPQAAVSKRSTSALRGRDASYLAPPAQIRTCGFPAYGLYGAFFVKGCLTLS